MIRFKESDFEKLVYKDYRHGLNNILTTNLNLRYIKKMFLKQLAGKTFLD